MRSSIAVLVAPLILAGGCCRDLGEDLDPSGPREHPPEEQAAEVDLGEAAHPPKNDAPAVLYRWWVPKLEPAKYRVGYRMPEGEAGRIRRAYHQWASALGHRRIDEHRFQWRPPRRCMGGLHCVYETLDDQSLAAVLPVAERFVARAQSRELSLLEAASLAITFVQEITYRIPKEEPFGVKPPSLVVKEEDGDCDSKTLLAHMILRELGIESVIISSEAHKHTMLGLALPSAGTSFTHRGRRYAFVEMTAERAPIGFVDPRLLRPNDWRVVAMRYKPALRREVTEPPPSDHEKEGEGTSPPNVADIIRGGRIRIER